MNYFHDTSTFWASVFSPIKWGSPAYVRVSVGIQSACGSLGPPELGTGVIQDLLTRSSGSGTALGTVSTHEVPTNRLKQQVSAPQGQPDTCQLCWQSSLLALSTERGHSPHPRSPHKKTALPRHKGCGHSGALFVFKRLMRLPVLLFAAEERKEGGGMLVQEMGGEAPCSWLVSRSMVNPGLRPVAFL